MDLQIITPSNSLWLETLQSLRHDVYHLPEYLNLEARRTGTVPEAMLIQENDKVLFAPYLLRSCQGIDDGKSSKVEAFDIVSPYGYPGILLSTAAASDRTFLNTAIQQLIGRSYTRGICSVFLRLHPLLSPSICYGLDWPGFCHFQGETVSIDLTLSETEIWRQTKARHRYQINQCKKQNLIARMVSPKLYLSEFSAIYYETMDRVGAAQHYYFEQDYLSDLIDSLENKIHLCLVEWEDQIVCAGLFTECCGIVQFFLSGTQTQFLKYSPSKLMIDYVRLWAKKRGNKIFHLGGGVGATRDSLYHFKAGFSQKSHPFLTLRLVIDQRKYMQLVRLHAESLNLPIQEILQSTFFPAYRFASSDTQARQMVALNHSRQ